MADEPETPKKKLQKDGLAKLAAARVWKSMWELDLRECYFFADPQRQRNVQSYSAPPQQRLLDAAELNTDLAFELVGDFTTEVINTYMPEAQQWCERGPGMFVGQEAFDGVKKKVEAADKQVFIAIKSSNFYAEFSKGADPDLAIGTMAMWIEPPRPGEPIVCSAIPLRELEVNLGPYGEIDDRFAVRHTRNCYVETLLGKDIWAKVSDETKKTLAAKPAERTMITWGFWRLWDRHDDECWQHVVYLKNEMVHDAVLVGEGSCPLLVWRWNPGPDWPWGHGPLLQGMPTLRQVDELELQRSEHGELSLRPPLGYPDDSFAAIEQGLEPGMAYPLRVGSEKAVVKIYDPPPADAANYQYEEKEHRLRKLFFVDFPQQSGDTPPTLGQWLDEMARAQRRIGRPGLPFWREGPAKIFVRFKYLLERAGAIEPIKIDDKTISLMPYNPAQRAAEQQEIAMAVHGLQLCGQFFPEEFKAWIDGKKTMMALLDVMRVELVKFRDEKTVNEAVDRIQKLLAGTPPGGQVRSGGGAAPAQQALPAQGA